MLWILLSLQLTLLSNAGMPGFMGSGFTDPGLTVTPLPPSRGDCCFTSFSYIDISLSGIAAIKSPLEGGRGGTTGPKSTSTCRSANAFSFTADTIITWLTEQDHDFGKLRQGRPATFVFKFKNTATETILLQTVRTTCGCTAARYTEEPIAPGETGEIAIEYDAYRGGAFAKKIRVFFDRQKKAEILWIRGEVD